MSRDKQADDMVREFNKNGTVRQATPSDLKYVGADKGLAKLAANSIKSSMDAKRRALKELDEN